MEKPLCRLCGSRHSLSEPHKFATSELAARIIGAEVPEKIAKDEKPARLRALAGGERAGVDLSKMEPGEIDRQLGLEDEAVAKFVRRAGEKVLAASEWDCPVCVERRRKAVERTKRWRGKKATE